MNALQGLLAATRRGLGSLSVVMATGLYKTAAGVVGQRLLKENAEGLRQYLTIQLRTTEAAQQALASLEDAIEHGSKSELDKGPTRRAALFLAARNLAEYERMFGEDAADKPLSSVPFEPTPPGRPEGWGRALDEVRFTLSEGESEILALHHAFDLNEAELAYVLGLAKADVRRRLEAGAGYAKLLIEDILGEGAPPLAEVFRDAFRCEPPTPEEIAAAVPKVVPLPAGTLIGDRYEIEHCIGGGEFAFVYRARDVRVPGHMVALKLLHRVARSPAAREGAIRELSLIASAFHPSLVQFKDHGWFEERLWFVMPFYEGEMLLDALGRGSLPLEDALTYFERLARGLAALHASGIRHQDVKPENIFLVRLPTGADGHPEILPILLDLGVASPNGEMALAGTPMYFPPEVAAHIFDEDCDLPLTPKADVFALALSLLHSIEAPDLSELEDCDVDGFLRKRVSDAPSGPTTPELRWLAPRFERWLASHPNDRPSAGELAEELSEVLSQVGGPAAGRDRRRRRGAPRAALRPLLVATALFGLCATAAITTDTPARTLTVAQAASPAASDDAAPTARAEAPPEGGASSASEQAGSTPNTSEEPSSARLLRHRLELESRRARELEVELTRYRRQDLGLDERAPVPRTPPAAD